jgi:hypothetical protein
MLPAIFAVVLLVVGQLVALAHQAAQRHVTCAEHGEQLDAVALAEPLHACGDDHFVAVDDAGGEHADCPIMRALHQSCDAPVSWVMPSLAYLEAPELALAAITPRRDVSSLYLIAPKTSPPV